MFSIGNEYNEHNRLANTKYLFRYRKFARGDRPTPFLSAWGAGVHHGSCGGSYQGGSPSLPSDRAHDRFIKLWEKSSSYINSVIYLRMRAVPLLLHSIQSMSFWASEPHVLKKVQSGQSRCYGPRSARFLSLNSRLEGVLILHSASMSESTNAQCASTAGT